MLILALDSTALVASVALCRDEQPIASFTVKNGNTHSETLLPMVEAVLRSANATVDDVDLFACSTGPGSFTGVRIGTATVKGLAFGKNKPCIGISTLEALAQNLIPFQGIICPVMNARRGQVYNALFYVNQGKLERIAPDRAIALTDLAQELAALAEPIFLVGDGSVLTHKTLSQQLPLLVLPPEHKRHQRATGVAIAAAQLLSAGETGDGAALQPNYLRLSQAERERLERENK